MLKKRGYTLVSQQIRDLITSGFIQVPEKDLSRNQKNAFFTNEALEARVQPASFEPILAEDVFILDTNRYGLLRPRRDEQVYRTLLQIPLRGRNRKTTIDGLEIKSGHSYLVKLDEKISQRNECNPGITSIKSSPKSSIGRLFPKARLLCDFNPSFDVVYDLSGKSLDMWLLIQPLPFDLILWPGLTLNQLRFYHGDARLTDEELREEFRKKPLLYEKCEDGKKTRLRLKEGVISDGLRLTLDGIGPATQGVFGLRARKNPDPIDLSKEGFYTAEDYFEPMISGKRDSLKRADHYLLASNEILKVPAHLSAELRKHSGEGLDGRMHDAGFVDPGFFGDMVVEFTPDEETDSPAEHRMPLSSLDFFRTNAVPNKIYGKKIGSNYQGQIGPRISKHFKPFDFEDAARNHEKLSRSVLVEDAKILKSFRRIPAGFEPIRERDAKRLISLLENGLFHSRYDCEQDGLVLQLIPYTIAFDKDGRVFSYIRTEDKKEYGDKRLLGKHSIGLGGHATMSDAPNTIINCLEREVTVEEVRFSGRISQPRLVGTLYAEDKPVDKVHFGLIYVIHTDGKATLNEKSISYGRFVPLEKVTDGFRGAETETWTKILIPHLKSIYGLSNPNYK